MCLNTVNFSLVPLLFMIKCMDLHIFPVGTDLTAPGAWPAPHIQHTSFLKYLPLGLLCQRIALKVSCSEKDFYLLWSRKFGHDTTTISYVAEL